MLEQRRFIVHIFLRAAIQHNWCIMSLNDRLGERVDALSLAKNE